MEWTYNTPEFFTSELDTGEWSDSPPGCFTLTERLLGTLWLGGWVELRDFLDATWKKTVCHSLAENRNPVLQPLAESMY